MCHAVQITVRIWCWVNTMTDNTSMVCTILLLMYSQGRGHDGQWQTVLPGSIPREWFLFRFTNTTGSQILLVTRPIIPVQYATFTFFNTHGATTDCGHNIFIVRYATLIWRDIWILVRARCTKKKWNEAMQQKTHNAMQLWKKDI